jgi:NAD(P)H-dependent FMN reductase
MDSFEPIQTSSAAPRVAVVAGSTRPGRQAVTIAEWVCSAEIPGLDLNLVDLARAGLGLLDEPTPAAFADYHKPETNAWSELIAGFDAYILVTPEYNHSTSAALKNALDHLYWEWRDKPVAFVGYGLDGGTRAVEHLRGVVAELGMPGVGPQVSINLVTDYTNGRFEPRSVQVDARTKMLDQLAAWAAALRSLRRRKHVSPGQGRPTLHDPTVAEPAVEALRALVATLAEGVEQADANIYDEHFANDILWGNPYGGTLSGYTFLNGAHKAIMAAGGAPPSRFEIVQSMTPTDGVIIAHVRRHDLSPATDPGFSETALYVFVEHGGRWWLAAGQNTPIANRRD